VIFLPPVATVKLDRRDSERPRYPRPDRVAVDLDKFGVRSDLLHGATSET
jgi:hypothetical protein